MSVSKSLKASLRRDMKVTLMRLSDQEKARQSKAVTKTVLDHDAFKKSHTVALYLSMNDEIQTMDILQECFRLQKKCFIPRYFNNKKEGSYMEMVLLKSLQDLEDLPVTKWNIKQPADDEVREEALQSGGLDLILVPGLAFTRTGKRLGRGKGFYDSYLAKCKTMGKMPHTLALAFKEQIVDEIPVDEHDFIIDEVISEETVE